MMFIYVSITIYVILLFLFCVAFKKVKRFSPSSKEPKHSFSIVVPFRNEAHNLPQLLKSIEQLNYPIEKFEVILVDDESSDGYRVSSYGFRVVELKNIRNSNSPKKDAIQTAITGSNFDWVITTDADCVVPKNWLLDLDIFIQTEKKEMVCGPVLFKKQKGYLCDFQKIEMLSLQSVTISSFGLKKPFMCNGANLAYTKKIFHEVNGFEGNSTIASGDDVFLLQKVVVQFPEKVGFLLNSNYVVETNSAQSWKELFYQRVRWAGKSTAYSSFFGKFVALVILFGNLAFIMAISFLCMGYFKLIPIFILKILVDLFLANQTATFYQIRMNNRLLTALFYPFFSSAVALYSLFGKYEWKDRKI